MTFSSLLYVQVSEKEYEAMVVPPLQEKKSYSFTARNAALGHRTAAVLRQRVSSLNPSRLRALDPGVENSLHVNQTT